MNGMTMNNLLLDALDEDLLDFLQPHLRPAWLNGGEIVDQSGGMAYFPESLVAAPIDRSGGGGALGLIGQEGVIGWSPLNDAAPDAYGSMVLFSGGEALAIPTITLQSLVDQSARLHRELLRFVGSFTLQMARTMASNLRDPLERRLARWLAMLHDRVGGDTLSITHSSLADALCVRRASVTDALHILEGNRVLRCTRAMIVVRDRAGLETAAGASYGKPEAIQRRVQPVPVPVPTSSAIERILVSLC